MWSNEGYVSENGWYRPKPATGASYTGPGDVAGYSSAYAYWGLRAYTATYAATLGPAIDVVDKATRAITTTINVKADGTIDVAAITALGYAVCVHKIYDQSGNARHVTTLAAQEPDLVMSGVGLGSVPSMKFDSGVTNTPYFISASNAAALAQPLTVSSVVRYDGIGGVFSDGTFDIQFRNNNPASIQIYAGTGTQNGVGVTNGQFGSTQAVYNGASSSLNAANAGTNPTGAPTTVGSTPGSNGINTLATPANAKLTVGAMTDAGSSNLEGYLFEVMVLPSAVSPTNQALQVANQRAYGGF